MYMSYMGFIAVGAGAALGAWGRWLLGLILNPVVAFLPLGTLIANLVGGYLMGLAIGAFALGYVANNEWRLFITTGFLGGLTTFSAFSAEAVGLLSEQHYSWAAAHIVGHVVGSLLMTAAGILTIQFIKS
jgi:CrcB protein